MFAGDANICAESPRRLGVRCINIVIISKGVVCRKGMKLEFATQSGLLGIFLVTVDLKGLYPLHYIIHPCLYPSRERGGRGGGADARDTDSAGSLPPNKLTKINNFYNGGSFKQTQPSDCHNGGLSRLS